MQDDDVSDEDRELRERLRRLESINAQMARSERVARLGLMLVCAVGVVALAVMGYVILGL